LKNKNGKGLFSVAGRRLVFGLLLEAAQLRSRTRAPQPPPWPGPRPLGLPLLFPLAPRLAVRRGRTRPPRGGRMPTTPPRGRPWTPRVLCLKSPRASSLYPTRHSLAPSFPSSGETERERRSPPPSSPSPPCSGDASPPPSSLLRTSATIPLLTPVRLNRALPAAPLRTELPRSRSGHRRLRSSPSLSNCALMFTVSPRWCCVPRLVRSSPEIAAGHRRPSHRRGGEHPCGRARCPARLRVRRVAGPAGLNGTRPVFFTPARASLG
jgi:hypothetical protein